MTPPAPEPNRQNPIPLIAVASAVAGLVASRSVLGRVAIAAAAGAAAYRWANTHKSPTPAAQKDATHFAATHSIPGEGLLAAPESREKEPAASEPIFPPAPEYTPTPPADFVASDWVDEEEWIGPNLDSPAFNGAPADYPQAAYEIAATFEEEESPVFEGDPVLQTPSTALTNVTREEPSPLAEVKPAPLVRDEPAPMVMEEPAPVVMEEPAPVVMEEPASMVMEEPAPLVEEQPALMVMEEPAPLVEEEPAPLVMEEPTPLVEEEPARIAIEEVTPLFMDEPAPLVEIPATSKETLAPTFEEALALETSPDLLFQQPQWVLSMEPLPPVAETKAADINASLFDSDVFTRSSELAPVLNEMEVLADAPTIVLPSSSASERLCEPSGESALASADTPAIESPFIPVPNPVPETANSVPPLSRAPMTELLPALSKKVPEFTKPEGPNPAELAAVDGTAELRSEPKHPSPFASADVPPPAQVPISVTDLFAKLAPRVAVEDPAESPSEQTLEPETTSASGTVRNKNRPMITVPSATNPLRKNWLTWWK